MTDSVGLSACSAAPNCDISIKQQGSVCKEKWLLDSMNILHIGKISIYICMVNHDVSLTFGKKNSGNRFFSTTSAIIKRIRRTEDDVVKIG